MTLLDLNITIRYLRKSPLFTLTAVLMLALGIGATTAVFSVVEAVLLRPLPFPESERLVSLGDILQGAEAVANNGAVGVTGSDIKAYTRDTHSFQSLGGYQPTGYELSGVGEPAQVNATRMTAGAFAALATPLLKGRFFTQQEDDQNEQVAIVSYSLWQNRLHGDPHVLGTKILLDRKPYEVIGIMPRDFEFPLAPGHLNSAELWVPMSFTSQEMGLMGQSGWNFSMVGRLKTGTSAVQAQQDAERVAQNIMHAYPPYMATLHIQASVKSLREETVQEGQQLVRVLFMATAVVLLIACANLAGLLLVRAIRRRREIAMRLALGARALALLRQSMLESLVLSVTGGGFGLIFAAMGLRLLVSRLPETMPRIDEIRLDWQMVLFAISLSLLTGIGCGLAPAFAAWRTSVNETLKQGGRSGAAGGHAWLRGALVVSEIATALVLLAAAGLLLRSFEKMRSVDLGYRPDHLLVANYSLPQKQYATQSSVDSFNHELLDRIQHLPGVKFAGLTTFLPATGSTGNSAFVVEGYVAPSGSNLSLATPIEVIGDYLQAMQVPLLAGRFFTPTDTADTQLVAIVNRKLAEHYWPGQDPLGKRIRIGLPETQTPWITVVGEVADVKETSPDDPTKEELYQPVDQRQRSDGTLASPTALQGNGMWVAMRTTLDPNLTANALRASLRSIDPMLPLTQVQSLESALSDSEAPRRFNTWLISAFAFAAISLAALGIYSVIAFSAALRVQEMAIRMALGSQRSSILGLIFLSAVKLALAGCGVGLVATVAVSRLLDSLLFAVSPFDPVVLTLSAVFVIALAITASLLPAARTASIDPMKALRAD